MKILSLDGGGTWAMVQARCLMDLYGNITGHRLLRRFDMVIANSGGAMMLAALMENRKLSQVVDLFMDSRTRKQVFSGLGAGEKSLAERVGGFFGIGPKYSAERKLDGLRALLPETGNIYLSTIPTAIGQPRLRVIICAYDYQRNRAVFFRSDKHSLADSGFYEHHRLSTPRAPFKDVTLAEAVHASANAPVNYFQRPAQVRIKGEKANREYWDGAVGGYNNPVFAAVLEATVNGIPPADIHVLSLGTGTTMLPLRSSVSPAPTADLFLYQDSQSKFVTDIRAMATSILADPPDSATFHAYAILHPTLPQTSSQFFRFSPVIAPCYDSTAGWAIPSGFSKVDFKTLIDLDMDAVKQSDADLIAQLSDQWLSPQGQIGNQAIRYNAAMQAIMGHSNYQEARQVFRTSMFMEES